MTQDGGLQRLVRLLVEFTTNPPAPSPNTIYGLSPPTPASFKSPALSITDGSSSLNFTGPYDKSAAHRFSLAFQSVVNIGVRGNEDIRARVVRAGTLDVVSSVLKAWLTARGFAVGPSSSATGVPRESREQRMARRAAASRTQAVEGLLSTTAAIGHPSRPDAPSGPRPERRRGERETTRETAHELQRALRRSIAAVRLAFFLFFDIFVTNLFVRQNDIPTSSATLPHPLPIAMPTPGLPQAQVRTRPELSAPPTSAGSSTTHSSASPSPPPAPPRSRSGTVTRPVAGPSNHHHLHPHTTPTSRQARHSFNRESTGSGSSADNSRAETETEDDENGDDTDTQQEDQSHGRARPQEENDAHIVISDFSTVDEAGGDPAAVVSHPGILGDGDMVHGMGGVGVGGQNDDFAMGAPPGAPGAIGVGTMNINITIPTRTTGGNGPVTTLDVAETPRARTQPLPMTMNIPAMAHPQHHHHHHHHHHPPLSHPQGNGIGKREGMYRDEDVLLALQLLAYLSKYPHVRQAFYKSRGEAPPAAIMISQAKKDDKEKKRDGSDYQSGHTGAGGDFFRAFLGRGHSHNSPSSSIPPSASSTSGIPTNSTSASSTQPTPPIRHTNVFSLVERFTFRPSSAETGLPNPPPKLPPEIQYWAGVIMRNACRKDESRGGVRQCANSKSLKYHCIEIEILMFFL